MVQTSSNAFSIFLEVFGSACFSLKEARLTETRATQTSARQMLHPEDRRSGTGDAFFVCS